MNPFLLFSLAVLLSNTAYPKDEAHCTHEAAVGDGIQEVGSFSERIADALSPYADLRQEIQNVLAIEGKTINEHMLAQALRYYFQHKNEFGQVIMMADMSLPGAEQRMTVVQLDPSGEHVKKVYTSIAANGNSCNPKKVKVCPPKQDYPPCFSRGKSHYATALGVRKVLGFGHRDSFQDPLRRDYISLSAPTSSNTIPDTENTEEPPSNATDPRGVQIHSAKYLEDGKSPQGTTEGCLGVTVPVIKEMRSHSSVYQNAMVYTYADVPVTYCTRPPDENPRI